jgi:hypothetical protein
MLACSWWVGFVDGRWMVGMTAKRSSTICDHYLSVQEQGRQRCGHCLKGTSCVLVCIHPARDNISW